VKIKFWDAGRAREGKEAEYLGLRALARMQSASSI